ncbi:hypothetical protein BPY_22780 [Bifidobacterium psychraerophilum]|uniref:hypothetical protein n=1 Tax=Bifidobacterium psychraerophilum TaxID=218140 RepID=UPI00310F1205
MEWDETERAWMLALDTYEKAHICPVCGMDTDFCHDKQQVTALFASAQVDSCFIGEMRENAMQRFADSGIVQTPHSKTTTLIPRH